MRPVRLAMEGFGGFRSATTVDFDDLELVALVGKTGSGKSTIIDAITFALYGMVSRYDDGRKVHPVINSLATEAKVQFVFESGGVEYNATRVIRRTKTGASTKEARFQNQQTVLAEGAKEVTAAAEGVLGLDFAQFTKVVVLPQGRFSAFLRDSAKDRRVMLAETLGVSRYDAIGRTAREIAKNASIKADEKRATLQRFESQTGDVKALEQDLDALRKISVLVEQRTAQVRTLTNASAELKTSQAQTEVAIKKLQAIEIPATVSDLDDKISAARQALERSSRLVEQHDNERERAIAAFEAGPDVERSQQLLDDFDAQAGFANQLGDVEVELSQAAKKVDEAEKSLLGYSEKIQVVEQELADAETQESECRNDLADGPNLDGINLTRSKRHELTQLQSKVVEQQTTIEATQTQLLEAQNAFELEQAAVELAEQNHQRVVDSEQGAALRHSLVIGEPCPVCETNVERLPTSDLSGNVAATDEQRIQAQRQAVKRKSEVDKLQQLGVEQLATKQATDHRIEELNAELAEAPTETDIKNLEQQVAQLEQAMRQASKRRADLTQTVRELRSEESYKHAERQSKRAAVTLQKLEKKQAALSGQLSVVESRLATAPNRDELQVAIAEALELKQNVEQSRQRYNDTTETHTRQIESLDLLLNEATSRRSELTAARDSVSELRPPSPTNDSLLNDWRILASWATEQLAIQKSHVQSLEGEIAANETAVQQQIGAIGDIIDDSETATAGIDLRADISSLDPQEAATQVERTVAAAMASISGQHKLLSAQSHQISQIQDELAAVEQIQQVHELLGEQLKASNFQDWILSEIVTALADRASERLFELSAGQFSLVASELNFEVIDHTNGDSRRDARTLSGGETFLASLALALALADGIVEMSANITNPLESLFLDEGFGTLDDDYLDIVASAVEELGAHGRTVVVITHIDELADRLPTRFELTKIQGDSSIKRVDV